MKFQFDGNQPYQLRAIESVAALLQGQPRVGLDWSGAGLGELFGPVRNRLLLDESQLLTNLQEVQRKNQLGVDDRLQCIEEEIQTTAGTIKARFPNYSVEMETGTGKTYVYTRTALELHRRYGWRKFIVGGHSRGGAQVAQGLAGAPARPVRQRALSLLGVRFQEHRQGAAIRRQRLHRAPDHDD